MRGWSECGRSTQRWSHWLRESGRKEQGNGRVNKYDYYKSFYKKLKMSGENMSTLRKNVKLTSTNP